MYYDRTLSREFAQILMEGGKLRWLLNYVKVHPELDFGIVKSNGKERIIVYRGLTKIMQIEKMTTSNLVKVTAAEKYKKIAPELYGKKALSDITEEPIDKIIRSLKKEGPKETNYNNKKEGYYQNRLSKEFGVLATEDSDFILIEKEVVIGYKDNSEKEQILSPLKASYMKIQEAIYEADSKTNHKKFGKNIKEKSFGNEVDFLALNKNGDLLLMEMKHGSNTSGIYLSPLQIGMYYEILGKLPGLKESALNSLMQKQKIGLVNPDWKVPTLTGKIIPALIVADLKPKSTAKEKFYEILEICRKVEGDEFLKDLVAYDYTPDEGLVLWE